MTTALESELESGLDFETALAKVIKQSLKATSKIIFNGDGYSDDWQVEAKKRGLLNLKTTFDALPYLGSDKNIKLFEKYHVLNAREVASRLEIFTEQYFLNINIEAETTANMVRTMIIPAAVRYLNELAAIVDRGKSIGLDISGVKSTAEEVNTILNGLIAANSELSKQNKELGGDEVSEKAEHMFVNVIPAMNDVRKYADQLEHVVADDYWPLPTYSEMLFIR